MNKEQGAVFMMLEADALGPNLAADTAYLMALAAKNLGSNRVTSDRAYSTIQIDGKTRGRWLYVAGKGHTAVTMKVEAALDALHQVVDGRERDIPEEPKGGDMGGWPYGKVVIFDREGHPVLSLSPQVVVLTDAMTGLIIPTGAEDARF